MALSVHRRQCSRLHFCINNTLLWTRFAIQNHSCLRFQRERGAAVRFTVFRVDLSCSSQCVCLLSRHPLRTRGHARVQLERCHSGALQLNVPGREDHADHHYAGDMSGSATKHALLEGTACSSQMFCLGHRLLWDMNLLNCFRCC